MKLKLIPTLIMLSRYAFYILIIQSLFLNLGLANSGRAQKSNSVREVQLSLDAGQYNVNELFNLIEKTSKFRFAFDRNDLKTELKQKIDISGNEEAVSDVLIEISKTSGVKFRQINDNITVTRYKGPVENDFDILITEDIEISGKVTDENGEGLPGATVVIKDGAAGTTTDLDGNFKLSVPEDAVLVVSFVGYLSKEVSVGNQSQINVALAPNAQELSEVVVIGYGERSKRDVTTAISQISSEEITKRFSMSPEMAMQGQMSGVQVTGNNGNPMSRPTIRVRGTNTWGVADPVYVVDGVMLEEYGAGIEGQTQDGNYYRGNLNVMSLINPDDIESITVLKDASAAAIYGVRAANGVVLITTKSGRSGKPKVSFSSRLGWTNLPNHIDVLNSKQYADFNNALWASSPDSEILPVDDRVFNPSSPDYRGNAATTDWQSVVENQNAMTQDYSLSFSGGTENVNYFASIGKSSQDGVYIGNYLDRLSGTFKLNLEINRWLRSGFNGRIASSKSGDAYSSTLSAATGVPFQPIYDPNGINGYAHVLAGYDDSGNWTGERLYGTATTSNIPARFDLDHVLYKGLRGTGRVFLEAEPINGLKINGALSLDNTRTGIDKIYPFIAGWFNPQGSDPNRNSEPGSLGNYNVITGNNLTRQFDVTVNYQTSINDHKIDFLIGTMGNNHYYEYQELYSENVTTIDPDLITLGPGITNSAFNRRKESARFGSFLRAGYNYASKYYLDFSIRRDGSTSFAPDYRWGYFPAVSVAWRLSTESFMDDIAIINDLKFRAGYGKLGNDEVTPNAYLSTVNVRPNYVWGTTADGYGLKNDAATIFGLPNPTLTWETTTTFNIGFDSRLFNDLTFSFEYYDKLTEGLLQNVTIPPSSGIIDGPEANVGDVSNKGFETSLSYTKTLGEFTLTLGGNLTTQRNEVLRVFQGIPTETSNGRIEEGQSIGFFRGPLYGGTFQTDQEAQEWMDETTDVQYNEPLVTAGDYYFVDLYGAPGDESEFFSTSPDGQIDQFDQTYLGKKIAGYYYGLNVNVAYKGLTLDMVFYGVGDIQRYNSVRSFSNPSVNGANRSTAVLNAWTPQNTNTDLPRSIWGDPANNFRYSSLFIEDADYFRLTNIRLSYNFPKTFYSRIGNFVSNLNLYVGSSNTFTITDYSGLDPESDSNPAPRMIYTGFSINF